MLTSPSPRFRRGIRCLLLLAVVVLLLQDIACEAARSKRRSNRKRTSRVGMLLPHTSSNHSRWTGRQIERFWDVRAKETRSEAHLRSYFVCALLYVVLSAVLTRLRACSQAAMDYYNAGDNKRSRACLQEVRKAALALVASVPHSLPALHCL